MAICGPEWEDIANLVVFGNIVETFLVVSNG